MNELQIFNSGEFGDIRTITIDNEPWFVGIVKCGSSTSPASTLSSSGANLNQLRDSNAG